MGPSRFPGGLCAGRGTHKETRMLRRSLAAAFVLVALGGFVLAETFRGTITKADLKDDGTGTITVKVGKKGEEPTEKKFKITRDTKFYRGGGKGKEAKEVTDFKADRFSKMVEKAASAEKGP